MYVSQIKKIEMRKTIFPIELLLGCQCSLLLCVINSTILLPTNTLISLDFAPYNVWVWIFCILFFLSESSDISHFGIGKGQIRFKVYNINYIWTECIFL